MRASLSLRTIALPAIGILFLAVMLLGGCSGSNSSPSTSSSEQDQMKNTASLAQSESLPVGDTALTTIDNDTLGGTDNTDNDNATLSGVVVRGPLGLSYNLTSDSTLWQLSTKVPLWKYLLNHSGAANPTPITITITGTASDGTSVNIQLVGTPSTTIDEYTIAENGTITTAAGQAYTIAYTRDITHNPGVSITQVVSREITLGATAGGTVLYNENITRVIDMTVPAPRPRTLNGTIVIANLNDPSITRTVTFTNLDFYWPTGDNYRYFLSGTLAITKSTTGYTATLTAPAPADGSISGPIDDSTGKQVGTMKIDQGKVTVNWTAA